MNWINTKHTSFLPNIGNHRTRKWNTKWMVSCIELNKCEHDMNNVITINILSIQTISQDASILYAHICRSNKLGQLLGSPVYSLWFYPPLLNSTWYLMYHCFRNLISLYSNITAGGTASKQIHSTQLIPLTSITPD